MNRRLPTILLAFLLTGVSLGTGLHDLAHLHADGDPVQTLSMAGQEGHLTNCAAWHRGGSDIEPDNASFGIRQSPAATRGIRRAQIEARFALYTRGPARAPPIFS